ncbi:Fic family protein, partial [bacterium]|nr:Fic family protein [bacterium]
NSVVEVIKGTNIKKDVLKTSDPGPITETAMRDLVDWYNKTSLIHPWPIAVASEFCFRFLAIHPFQDGNGRLGRGLFLLALLQSGDRNLKAVIPYIALDRHIEKNKEEYYLMLRRCSKGKFSQTPQDYKIEYFLGFILKMLENAIGKDVIFYNGKYESFKNLADTPRKVLDCFKEYPEKKLGIKDILGYINLPRRTAIYAVNALIDEGFLQRSGKGSAIKYQLTF